jgi:hypothetical protein
MKLKNKINQENKKIAIKRMRIKSNKKNFKKSNDKGQN